ncbi:hydrogenase 2 operon protein HybA [Deferribacteraceae bacterium V6Fe1]|nr:hydrogenase 2 operon protein HybA [Deferribacteraceae bacterium V6Fe1]
MKKKSRREFLKTTAGLIAGTTVASVVNVEASEKNYTKDDAYSMLYDATLCVGCKACVSACKKTNGLPPVKGDFDKDGLWDAPKDLDSKTRTIIKLYKENEDNWSYVKQQCMHCAKPSCVSACPVKAMKQDENGVTFYNPDVCIGCRYCQVACPFNIPKFEWEKTFPKIVKCDMCKFTSLKSKGEPACTEVCPAKAVIFGKRKELLAIAKRRIKENPDNYINHIYGEHEAGGTNVIYLAAAQFEKLGFPKLDNESPATFTENIQHTVYKGFVAPVALYATLFFVAVKNREKREKDNERGDN